MEISNDLIFDASRFSTTDFVKGSVILIDKPLDWTSFDVVNKIRFKLRHHLHLKKIKVGHAGTLDPLASGLLILCTGKLTKEIDSIQAQTKVYTGTIELGATTATYDSEMAPDQYFPTDHIDDSLILEVTKKFIGNIEQIPPIYSAIKIKGQKAYDLARRGKDVEMKSRNVTISAFEIIEKIENKLSFKVTCSKGTYIRSLAHDFGKACHSGAYLGSLRREKIGEYDVLNAYTIDQFLSAFETDDKKMIL